MLKRRLRMLPPAFARCSSAWTNGSSPVVTSKRQWLCHSSGAKARRENDETRPLPRSEGGGARSSLKRVRGGGGGVRTWRAWAALRHTLIWHIIHIYGARAELR